MRVPIVRAAVVIALALLAVPAALASGPAELLDQIRETELDPARAVSLSNLDVELGHGLLRIEEGFLVPTRPIDGRTIEFVFVGRARVRIRPPDEIEAGQLELFTGQRSLDTPIESAVLVAVDPVLVERLLDRPSRIELRPSQLTRAEQVHREWLQKTRHRAIGIETGLFKALLDDSAYHDYFALWCRGYELGEFVYQLDPEDAEPLTLASFVPTDIRGWDRRRMERDIRIQQRKGRWLGVNVNSLGSWDLWMSTGFERDGEPVYPGDKGFEAQHYELDVTIARNKTIHGSAAIEMVAQSDDRRTATFELFRDIEVDSIRDSAGQELFFYRKGFEVIAVLPQPTRAGERMTLTVEFNGRAMHWVDRRTFDLDDTANWYPHCGSVDRATYDVTLRWPRKYGMFASGKVVEEGSNRKQRWQRRRLDQPSIAFSFVIGDFVVDRIQAGHVEITVAFNRASSVRLTEATRRPVLQTIASALEYFERSFGPYPLDYLTVVTLPRGGLPVRYSQSYMGYITLTDTVAADEASAGREEMDWLRSMTVAHEIAHQWWGNLLGWWSYRDQWLSEAMANYSALRFYSDRHHKGVSFLGEMSSDWRRSLSRTTLNGRTVESLGPIVLGSRLNSSMAGNGYRAIVFRKGAVVLAMLARAIGEEPFQEMLRSLVLAAGNRVVTTESFIDAIERMSGLDLDGFSRQFIYGTGIPQLYYGYEITPHGAGWLVSGEAHRLQRTRYEQRIQRSELLGWDVTRRTYVDPQDEAAALMVPFRILTEAATPASRSSQRRRQTRAQAGTLFLKGSHDSFEIEVADRPVRLEFDPLGEILARFYSVGEFPKRVARYQAEADALAGRLAAAEQGYRRALELPVGTSGERSAHSWMSDPEREFEESNAEIRLALARQYLDQRRDSEAQAELQVVEGLLAPARQIFRVERDVLQSRLDLRRGNYADAFRRLKKTLRIAAPRGGARGWQGVLWSLQLSSERLAISEAYALLAIAAYEIDDDEEMLRALQEAEGHDVDVSELRQMTGSPSRPGG